VGWILFYFELSGWSFAEELRQFFTWRGLDVLDAVFDGHTFPD
jgi:hypothetical protein